MSECGGIGIVQPVSLTYVYEYEFLDGLKYIKSLESNTYIKIEYGEHEIQACQYIKIPNKPLHLYTEQEDIKLLKILVSLKE